MKQAYYCIDCGHVFILSGSIVDGRNCVDCHGLLIPCTIGLDLASGKDQTPQRHKTISNIPTRPINGASY